METLSFFNQGWVGALIGLIGIAYAVYSYKKSKVGGRLVYQTSTMSIVGHKNSELKDVDILYKGNTVSRIVKTNMIIWNNGYKEVDGNKIVTNDPLKVKLDNDEEIIDIYLKACTKKVNGFSVNRDSTNKNIALLNFEYLDPQDGVFLEILHTDINANPRIEGSIKGLPDGVDYLGNIGVIQMLNVKNKNKSRKKLGYFIMAMGILIITLFSILPTYISWLEYTLYTYSTPIHPLKFIFFSLGFIYIILSGWILFTQRRKYPKKLENIMQFSQKENS